MDKRIRTIIFIIYVLLGFATECFILWLFPYIGFGGMFSGPIALVLISFFSIMIYRITKSVHRIKHLVIIFLSCFLCQTFLMLITTKQEFSGSTMSQISDTFNAYFKYDKIEFDDFFSLTTGERVVYIYKFRDKLPDSFVELSIVNENSSIENKSNRKYIIRKVKDKKIYNEDKLRIVEKDTSTIITEYLSKTDTLVFKAHGNFINSESGGCYNGDIWISVKEDNFKFHTGIEKLLFSILRH